MADQRPDVFDFDVKLPVRGVHQGTAWHQFPEGYTPDCSNVIAYDSLGRARIGVRPGTAKYWNYQFGGAANVVQHMHQATSQYIIVVAGGKAYRIKASDSSGTRIDGGGAATFSAARFVDAVTFQNITYFTDGLVKKKYNHGSGAFADWTASSGTFPVAGGEYPRFLAVWRGRIVLYGLDNDVNNIIYFTKQNDPTNFDVGATFTPDVAVDTATNFRAGQLSQVATAMMPVTEDVMLVGLDHAIYKFVGDPADGGALVPVSETVGVINNKSWCEVGGVLYFVGSGGFYRMPMGQPPECLSDQTFNSQFLNLPHKGNYVSVQHDRDRHGIWIWITHAATTFATKHAFWDLRSGGFFPFSYPANTGGDDLATGTTAPTHGPTCSMVFDGGDSTVDDRVVLIGGRDGYVRAISDTALNDDGTAISSYCWLGPVQLDGSAGTLTMNGHYPILGESGGTNTACAWALYGGADPYAAYTSSSAKSGTFSTAGRQSPQGHRLTSNSFLIKVSNSTVSKTWDLERWTLRLVQAGPNR